MENPPPCHANNQEDFMNSIADYLTFEFNMVTHGKGYLFEQKGGDNNA